MKQHRDANPLRKLMHGFAGSLISIKPERGRARCDGLFPYYAGYSSSFVRISLQALGSKPGWRVLDPWNGAGTTTAVADSLGCDGFGFDINPAASLVASARLARSADTEHASGLLIELLSMASRQPVRIGPDDPLLEWLAPNLVGRLRGIQHSILLLLGSKNGVQIDPAFETPPPFASYFLLCLMRAGREFICPRPSSNPTWTGPEKIGSGSDSEFDRRFLEIALRSPTMPLGKDHASGADRPTRNEIGLSDSRELPIASQSVDAVVTSPPYCTRIDYFRATLFELATLGIGRCGARFRELRESAMGTNLIRNGSSGPANSHHASVRLLLERIQLHSSKDSGGYYLKHFTQYFNDAQRSLAEIHRVLKPGAVAVLVVQSSYYKNVPIALGELYTKMGSHLGFRSQVVLRVPVRRILAKMNPRATRHARVRSYSEDVVALHRVV